MRRYAPVAAFFAGAAFDAVAGGLPGAFAAAVGFGAATAAVAAASRRTALGRARWLWAEAPWLLLGVVVATRSEPVLVGTAAAWAPALAAGLEAVRAASADRAAFEARLAAGATAREALRGARPGLPLAACVAVVGAAPALSAPTPSHAIAHVATAAIVLVAGACGRRVGLLAATVDDRLLEEPPDEAKSAFRTGDPRKTYDASVRPRTFESRGGAD